MAQRQVEDWTALTGAFVEIRRMGGMAICSGTVDAVTEDGAVLWVNPMGATRRLYEKAELYEAWANEEAPGFVYRISVGSAQTSALHIQQAGTTATQGAEQ